MDYLLKYHKAVKNDVKRIDGSSRSRIKKVIESRLMKAPLKCGEPFGACWCLSYGNLGKIEDKGYHNYWFRLLYLQDWR